MQAFHDDAAVKQKYVERVKAHRLADNLIRGKGWENGRGCAVGCTLEAYNHAAYETELGIPEWLARVEDTLFEGMSEKRAMEWPREFLEAIPIGADLEEVKGPFLVSVLESTLDKFDHEKFPDVLKCVLASIALWQRDAIGSESWLTAARSAAAAARSAARSAAAAARSAATAAWSARSAAAAARSAESAAWSARSAAESARSAAAWSARSAAESARSAAAYEKFADKLLELMKNAK